MTRTFAVAIAFAAITIGIACAEPPAGSDYSRAEVKDLLRNAHTTEQYLTLASYFRARQVALKEQARSEMQEWDRRSQITFGITQKYPRPVDSSRNRYEYFTYEADKMSRQAAHFESLAATAPKSTE